MSGVIGMDKGRLFEDLAGRDAPALLELLGAAYDAMTRDQRDDVFGRYAAAMNVPPAPVDGATLLGEVELFRADSLAGVYYAPFAINSKNYMHVPEETREWFARLGDLLEASARLTAQGEHDHAAACFAILYALIDAMDDDRQIVFADELGGWMIPGDEKACVAAYMTSLAAVATPEEFAAAALPLARRDSWQNFHTHAYQAAVGAATAEQRALLDAEQRRPFKVRGLP